MEHVARFDGWVRFNGVAAVEYIDEVVGLSGMRAGSDGYVEIVGDDDGILQRVTVWTGSGLCVRDGAAIAAGARIAFYGRAEYRDRPFQHLRSGAARMTALLAARHPRRAAVVAPIAGTANVDGVGARRRVRIEADDGTAWQRTLGRRLERWWDGDRVDVGDALSDGERDHHELLRLWGRDRFERHLCEELDDVLSSAGVVVPPSALDLVVREAVVDTPDGPRLRPLRGFPDRGDP
jgi:hypothetical protein